MKSKSVKPFVNGLQQTVYEMYDQPNPNKFVMLQNQNQPNALKFIQQHSAGPQSLVSQKLTID
jgi:hypothetical protein